MPPESRREMTVAVKSQIQCQVGNVVAVRQLEQCPVHPELELVTIERNAFCPGELLGEIDGAHPNPLRNLFKAQSLALATVEQKFCLLHDSGPSGRPFRLRFERLR